MFIAGVVVTIVAAICMIAVWSGMDDRNSASSRDPNTLLWFYLRAPFEFRGPMKWPLIIGMYLLIPSIGLACAGWTKMQPTPNIPPPGLSQGAR